MRNLLPKRRQSAQRSAVGSKLYLKDLRSAAMKSKRSNIPVRVAAILQLLTNSSLLACCCDQ
jgi:hypothetical protein